MFKLLNLLALASVVVLLASSGATPAHALESVRHHHLNREMSAIASHHHHRSRKYHHDAIARTSGSKRTRSNTRRCKQRPANSTTAVTVSASATKSAVVQASPAAAKTAAGVSVSVSVPAPEPKAPAPSSSKAPAPSSASSNGSGGSKKVGLAWPNGPTSDLQYYATDTVGWVYTWSPDTPDPSNKYGLEFMPMLWGPNQISDFEAKVKAGYGNIILGFNEPNEKGQSNLDPGYAAQLWQQYIEPKRALGYQTCSPATSSNPNGFTWMDNFFQACNGGCTVDYICVHWYDVQASDFESYVGQWHSIYNKDIFITEFAPQNFNGGAQPSSSDIWAFYQEVMPWIEQTSYVKAAFPFGFMHDMSGVNMADQLMASSGQPTDLGSYIINGNY